MRNYINLLLLILLFFFTVLMIELINPYFSFQKDVGFLQIKQWIFDTKNKIISNIWITAFYIHVFTSILALVAGFTQFNKVFINTDTHRNVGKLYIIIILLLAGPTGFIMGILANGGIISIVSFMLLSLLWWIYTYKAFQYIKQKKYELHSKYMFRSYALTLSAITLRLWKFIIVNYITELPPMEIYQVVSWLGWVPNLIIAEILIIHNFHIKNLN